MSERTQARRNRRKEREETMESAQSLESTLGGDYISDEAPSEEDIKEAEDLKKDLKRKHRARRKELTRQLRSQSRENLNEEAERLQGQTKQKLDDTIKSTAEDKQRRIEHIRKKKEGEEKEADDEDKDVDTAEDTKPKRVDRKALAAALREKSRLKRSQADSMKEDELDKEGEDEVDGDSTIPIRSMRRDKRMPTRFDKGRTEDMERERRRKEKQLRLKELTPEGLRTAGEVPEEEAYKFFTKDWPQKERKKIEPPPGDEVDHTDDKEKTPLLDLDEDDDVPFKSTQYFVGIGRADYIPAQKKMEADEVFLYTPPVIELQLDQKIEHEPRFIEEEGLYVGRPTVIMPRNRNRLENRLIKEGNREWFGEDGRVKLLPDPLKEIPTRPALWDEEVAPIPDELKTDYINPILTDPDKKPITADQHGQYIVEVDVHSVVFTHHPLFTREHVLAQRLTDLFIEYEKLLERDYFDYCEQRICALKRAVGHLVSQKEVLIQQAEMRNEEPPISDLEERILEYRNALSKTRRWRNEHECKIRDTLIKMIETYKLMEKDRTNKGFTATKLHLIIRKESTNKELEEEEERKEIVEQINEKHAKFESRYNKLLRQYQKDLKVYEEQKARKVGALKRNKEREELGVASASSEQLIEESADTATSRKKRLLMEKEYEDAQILGEEDLECPVEPTPFNLKAVEDKIREQMIRCRRRPGEPIIDVILNDTKTITADDLCPRMEQQRRAHVAKLNYFVKILFNHKEVGVTDLRSLSSDFVVKFTKIYPIQILQFPEVITLRLFEKSGLSTRQIKDIDLKPPSSQSVQGRVKVEPHHFSCTQLSDAPKFTGVGSSIDFDFEAEQRKTLLTSGKFYSSVAWAINEDGDVMAPVMDLNSREFLTEGDGSNEPNPDDPNDPRNPKSLALVKGGHQDSDYFRLDHYQEIFNFCTSEDVASSNRYRLLKLRNRGIPEFKNQKVPLSENDIPKDVFKEYDDRRKEKKKDAHVRGFESRRLQQKYLLDRVRDEVMERFRQSLRQKTLNEVVHEEEIPNLSAFLSKLSKLTEPRRPLKPKRVPRKSVPAQNVSQLKTVLVRIVRAENVPIRDGDHQTLVQPIIEVRFQDELRVTALDEEGPNPHWNSNFAIPFRPPAKVTSLEQVSDVILINLYDRITSELSPEENIRRIKVEKRWLGSLEIPFNTVFMNTKVMGRFMIRTPDVLLGYKSPTSHANRPDHSSRPLLETDITIDPLIKPPEPIRDKEFESIEDRGLLRRAEEWLHRMEELKPNRVRRCTVLNMKIKEYFITRYLFKLTPPEDIMLLATELPNQKRAVARYVSLIPYMSDTQVFNGLVDIWSTSEQFLKMSFGDDEEHAVLLYNYFLHLHDNDFSRVFLCMGNAVPEGRTIYVLVKNTDNTVELWNPSTGDCFDKSDSHCPLISVGSLINPQNIWANVQEFEEPKDIHFDETNKKNWCPLFEGRESPLAGLATIQEPITYQATNEGDVTDIKMKLDNQLQQCIMNWRKGMITKWNYEFIKDLNELLRKLEKNKSSGKSLEELKNDPIFKKIGNRYKMYGFPMNLPYMELDEIVERVRATGIHTNNSRGLEFAVTTLVKSYSNSVLSIWIYIAYFERL